MAKKAIAIFLSGPHSNMGMCSSARNDPDIDNYLYNDNLEDSAKAFAIDVPPATVRAVYIFIEPRTPPSHVKRIASALEAVCYSNIWTNGSEALYATIPVEAAKIKCNVDELVAVIDNVKIHSDYGVILKKTRNGFKRIDSTWHENRAQISSLPSLKHIVVHDSKVSEFDKAKLRLLHPEKQIHFVVDKTCEHLIWFNYCWNKLDSRDRRASGCLVEECASMTLFFKFDDNNVPVDILHAGAPSTKSFQLDVAKADKLEVYEEYIGICHGPPELIKTFHFKSQKDRILNVTVSIDKHQTPSIEVKSIDPVKITTPPPSNKVFIEIETFNHYAYLAIGDKGLNKCGVFDNMADLVKEVQKKVPAKSVAYVQHNYGSQKTLQDSFDAMHTLRASGYSKHRILNIPNIISQCLFGYNVNVAVGDCVALLVGQFFYIVKRAERHYDVMTIFFPTDASSMFPKYDVKLAVHIPNKYAPRVVIFGDWKFIIGHKTALEERYDTFYLQHLLSPSDFYGCIVSEFTYVRFTASWSGKSKIFETGLVVIPYEWTVELDAGKADQLEVETKFPRFDFQKYNKTFNLKETGNTKVALTFSMKGDFDVDVSCAALPFGREPRPISLCLLIERTSSGIRKTVYFRDSNKTIVDDYPNLFVALNSFNQAEYAAIIFNVTNAIDVELAQWQQKATEYGFKTVHFVNTPVLKLNAILFDFDTTAFVDNKTVLVADMTADDQSGRKMPMTYVLKCYGKKLKVQNIIPEKVDKVYSSLNSVDMVYVAVDSLSKPPKLPAKLHPVFLKVSAESISNYLFSRVDADNEANLIVDDFTAISFDAKYMRSNQLLNMGYEDVPFSREVSIHVGQTKSLKIDTVDQYSKKPALLKEFTFKTNFDRVVVLSLVVDSNFVPSVKHVRSDPVPATIFEFTTDNRVIVHSDVVDNLEYPAYVSFGDSVLVGEAALLRLEKFPNTVVYDVYRFFELNFDPAHPDPSWTFKTSCGANNETVIQIGESTTTSTVCFGTIVSAVKRDVESKSNVNLTEVGIRMPPNSSVSQKVSSVIGDMLNAKLVVFV